MRAFRRRRFRHGGVSRLHHAAFRNEIRRQVRAVAVAFRADLLYGLDVIVLPRPQLHHRFVVGRSIRAAVCFSGGGRRAAEEDARAIFGKAEVAPVADREFLAETGRVRGCQFRSGARLAVPAIDFPIGLGGAIAVAEESHLGLVFIPGQLGILALARQQRCGRGSRIRRTRPGHEDAVLRGLSGRYRIDQLSSVIGDREFHHVRKSALGGIGQAAQHQVRSELRARAASRRRGATAPTAAAAPLLIAAARLFLRGQVGGGRSLGRFAQVSQITSGLFRKLEPLHTLDACGVAGSQIDDDHSVFRHLFRRLLLLLRLVDIGLRRKSREHQRLAIRRKRDGHGSRFGRRPLFRGGGGHWRRTLPGRLALLLAGDQVANHHHAIAYLWEQPVRQELTVRRQPLARNRAPPIVVVVVQRPLACLGERQRKQHCRGEQPCRWPKPKPALKHDAGIVATCSHSGSVAPPPPCIFRAAR